MTHYLDDSRFLASSNFTYVNTGAISCRMCLYWRSRNTDGRRVVLCARARHFTISDPPWFFPTFVFAPSSRSCHALPPYRSLCAVHRLVLVFPESLARAPHRCESAIAPLVSASNHAFQCRAAHHDRRSLATCPVAPASLHVAVRPVGSTHLPPAHLVIRPRRIPFTPPAGGTLELPLICGPSLLSWHDTVGTD